MKKDDILVFFYAGFPSGYGDNTIVKIFPKETVDKSLNYILKEMSKNNDEQNKEKSEHIKKILEYNISISGLKTNETLNQKFYKNDPSGKCIQINSLDDKISKYDLIETIKENNEEYKTITLIAIDYIF